MDNSVYSILYLSQALMEQKLKSGIKMLYAHSAAGDVCNPVYSAVSGLTHTIHIENPNFTIKTIGLEENILHSHSVINLILKEFEEDGSDDILYSHGERLVRKLGEIDAGSFGHEPPHVKKDGVYLITGGAGELGLIFAKYLVEKEKVKLVLTGRSQLDKNKEKRLSLLEKDGSQVEYIKADISKKEEVNKLVEGIRNRFGGINGIIHCAGVIRDSFVLRKKAEEMEQVLAPKVFGAIWLDEATKQDDLDFFVMFSSIAAMGNAGQGDYAYGNCFMDDYASERARRGGHGKTLSINWPLWKEGGMKTEDYKEALLYDSFGIMPLTNKNGIEAFELGLRLPFSQVGIMEGDGDRIRKALFQVRGNNREERQVLPEAVRPLEAVRQPEAVVQTETVVQESLLKDKTQAYLKNLLSGELKVPLSRLESGEPFESYGIDSIAIVNMTKELEKDFGKLPKTLFFEYQTIKELADYFVSNHQTKLIERYIPLASGLAEDVAPTKGLTSKLTERAQHRFAKKVPESEGYESGQREGIAIIGVSGRYPKARNLDEFWENLKNGRDCITEIPDERWNYSDYYSEDGKGFSKSKWGGFIDDEDKFDPMFFNITPREAAFMDPQERLFLETVWHTVEDAVYTRKLLSRYTVGVFVGVMYGQYQLFGAEESQKGNKIALGASFASIANRISYYFNFHGPSVAMDTMCSSSLTALHMACESIYRGECEVAVAGGVNLSIHPNKYILLSQGNFLSSDGRCRSFGEGGDGYVPGEGAGAVLLKPLKKAVQDGDRIYAVVKGSGINHGGKTNGYTVPNPNEQESLITRVLKNNGVHPRTLSFIEAHGTGTALGDPIEIMSLSKAFAECEGEKQFCSIGSVKSNIGHLEAAAGIAGITKIILQMKHKMLVPSIHSDYLNPNISFDDSPFYVQQELEEWKQPVLKLDGGERTYPRRAGISSFGAGGSNAHIILEEYENPSESQHGNEQIPQLVVLSAKNEERLKAYAKDICNFMEDNVLPNGEDLKSVSGLHNEVQKDILLAVSDIMNIREEDLNAEDKLEEYGFDILKTVELSDKINGLYDIGLNAEVFYEYNSIKAFTKYIVKEYKDTLIRHYRGKGKLEPVKGTVADSFSLMDMAYTLQVGREAMEERLAVIVQDFNGLHDKLTEFCKGGKPVEDLFRGTTRSKSTSPALLIEGEEGEEFIKKLIQTRKLSKLAESWVSGIEIDWKSAYEGYMPRRISLPVYPFVKERCWVKMSRGAIIRRDRDSKSEKLHPLIDRNISSFKEQKFLTRFDRSSLYLFTGKNYGCPLINGMVFLDMMRAAGEMSAEVSVHAIKDLEWSKPAGLASEYMDLQISLFQADEHVDCEIVTKGAESGLVVLAQGKLFMEETEDAQKVNQFNLEEIKKRRSVHKNGKECYAFLERSGQVQSSGLRVIEEFFANGAQALSKLALPEEMKPQSGEFGLHPALLNGALQTISMMPEMDKETESGLLYIPYSVTETFIINKLNNACYVYAIKRNTDIDQMPANEVQFDIHFLDAEGRELVRLSGFSVKAEGVSFGSSHKTKSYDLEDLLQKVRSGELTAKQVRKLMGVV
ncbi:MAG: SDR family NAD(P)-dependent oxidoreductase [Bacillota bacterium]|nr:SDR family NAD(P)-dependent oxidoreductase [Bacillota bacterium]